MGAPFTFIPYPNIPLYPGVPQLIRPAQVAIAQSPALAIGIGTVANLLISALQQPSKWGIFDQYGNRLGINPNSQSVLQAIGSTLLSQITGANPTVLSTFTVEFGRESQIASFPLEEGTFSNYNKVQLPATPSVTLILDGSVNDRTAFLTAIDDACNSTNLYSVVTPEIVYANYAVERYTYSRKASRGATLLIVEVALKEIRQTSAAFTTVPIVSPQNAASAITENNGITQQVAPAASTLKNLSNGISAKFSAMFGGG